MTTPFTAAGGIEGTKTFNRTTQETEIRATAKDPNTGSVTKMDTITDQNGKVTSAKTTLINPIPEGGQRIQKATFANGKTRRSDTVVSANGDSLMTVNSENNNITSIRHVYPSGDTDTANYSGSCSKVSDPGCHMARVVDTDRKTNKMTTTNYDNDGKVIGPPQVSDIPANMKTQAATLKAKQNQQNLAGAKQQNLLGKNLQGNALANKLHGQQHNLAADKQQGLASNKQQIQADVLNQIQNKSGSNLKTGALDAKKTGEAVQLNPQPLPPGPPPDKFTGIKQHMNDKFQTGSNKNLKRDFNKEAITHGNAFKEKVIPQTQSSNQFSEGMKHKTHNMQAEQFKAKLKSQNLNSSTGSQGAAKHNLHEKPRSN